jgi:flagellin-like hook-associated protein FlgL
VKINGAYEAVIQLDDGDASIDPRNVTLRQIMGKIDEQLAGYGTCDIDGGRLVIRAANGGEASTIEYSGANEAFNEFLFGETPTIKNGANDPTHGYYRSGSMFKVGDAISMGSALNATISINDNKASTAPLTLAVTIPDGLDAMGVVDAINAAAEADPAVSQAMLPEAGNQYKLAVLVDGDGNQVYPPLNGAADPEPGTLVYIKLQSHTWGTGSTVMVEPQSSADDAAMAALFGKGTENPPSAMGGVDGFKDEACLWLDVADAELQNINRIWTDLGARMSRGELAQNRLETNKLVTETLQSQNIDVDEAYALMMLQMAETVYSASLATGARVIQPTLLDFIS